jgi:hypothetical protein
MKKFGIFNASPKQNENKQAKLTAITKEAPSAVIHVSGTGLRFFTDNYKIFGVSETKSEALDPDCIRVFIFFNTFRLHILYYWRRIYKGGLGLA